MSPLRRLLSVDVQTVPWRAYCFIVGREFHTLPKRRLKLAKASAKGTEAAEEEVSFQVGCIMGGAMGLGMLAYFLDPKRPLNTTDSGTTRRVWPQLANELDNSILDRSEDPEAALKRISDQEFTRGKQAAVVICALATFRSSRLFWARRWGELEFQRSVIAMPWTPTFALLMHIPMTATFLPFVASFAWQNRQHLRNWAEGFPFGLREKLSWVPAATWLTLNAYLITCFALCYAVLPSLLLGAHLSVRWASRRAAGF